MREIKFRAWSKNTKKMFDCPGFDFINGTIFLGNENRIQGGVISYYLSSYELMQFTGLHDKNGLADIYEGDIIGVDGLTKGNVYETPESQIYESREIFKQGVACVVGQMGTRAWRDSEQTLLGLGCKYAK